MMNSIGEITLAKRNSMTSYIKTERRWGGRWDSEKRGERKYRNEKLNNEDKITRYEVDEVIIIVVVLAVKVIIVA
jgi:hypothetical protein